jgi:hypothetical protein
MRQRTEKSKNYASVRLNPAFSQKYCEKHVKNISFSESLGNFEAFLLVLVLPIMAVEPNTTIPIAGNRCAMCPNINNMSDSYLHAQAINRIQVPVCGKNGSMAKVHIQCCLGQILSEFNLKNSKFIIPTANNL